MNIEDYCVEVDLDRLNLPPITKEEWRAFLDSLATEEVATTFTFDAETAQPCRACDGCSACVNTHLPAAERSCTDETCPFPSRYRWN